MKFRKKPVVIEAIQFKLLNMDEVENFVGGDFGKNQKGETVIATLEGAMICSLNDWIIKGVNGEFYPCKPDIFEKTYEPADAKEEPIQSAEEAAIDYAFQFRDNNLSDWDNISLHFLAGVIYASHPKEELCADEIRGILWKHSDSSDEPENSWIDKDKFETIIAELKSLQFKQEPKI